MPKQKHLRFTPTRALRVATPAQVRAAIGDIHTIAEVEAKAAEMGISGRSLYGYLKNGVVVKIGPGAAAVLDLVDINALIVTADKTVI